MSPPFCQDGAFFFFYVFPLALKVFTLQKGHRGGRGQGDS